MNVHPMDYLIHIDAMWSNALVNMFLFMSTYLLSRRNYTCFLVQVFVVQINYKIPLWVFNFPPMIISQCIKFFLSSLDNILNFLLFSYKLKPLNNINLIQLKLELIAFITFFIIVSNLSMQSLLLL